MMMEEDPSESAAPTNPYYSVARQRARQRLHNAHKCHDVDLRAKRLAAALHHAERAGLSPDVLGPTQEELDFVKGVKKALEERPCEPDVPSSGPLEARPVTPVYIKGPLSETVMPGVVALLTLTDNGIAELRDAANPSDPPFMSRTVFDEEAVRPAPSFSLLRRDFDATKDNFNYAALQVLLEGCNPHRAIVAVVDPLRPGGQILCNRCLRDGPQGLLCGVVAAVPSVDTPSPLSGPSYAAISVLLCLGSESLGLGGVAWSGGGVFGRALGFADRAAAYLGGWPSAGLGRLAYRVAVSADRALLAGGSAGEFHFGYPPGSAAEAARAQAVRSWLKGGTQACHTSRAWVHHFASNGVEAHAHNEGPMWLYSAEKAGRWPGFPEQPVTAALNGEEEGGEPDATAAVEADDGDENAEADAASAAKEAAAVAAVAQEEDIPDDCVKVPPGETVALPPAALKTPVKYAVHFGSRASELVSGVINRGAKFSAMNSMESPESCTEPFGEALIVVDLSDPMVLTWPSGVWKEWVAWSRLNGSVLSCAAILPSESANSLTWNSIILALESFIENFGLVIWLGDTDCDNSKLELALAGLLNSSVSFACLAAHLSPVEQQHFAVAYHAPSAALFQTMAANKIADVCCVAAPAITDRGDCNTTELQKKAPGINFDDVATSVHSFLFEYLRNCGSKVRDVEPEAPVAAAPVDSGEPGEGKGADGAQVQEPGAAADEAADTAEPAADSADAGAEADGAAAEDVGDGDAGNVSGRPVSAPPTPFVSEAKLLAFVVGEANAAAELEEMITVRGQGVLDNIVEGPSLAYPNCAYGFDCVAPRPWGASWDEERKDVVMYAVHSRTIYAIMARIVAGLPQIPPSQAGREQTPYQKLREQHALFHLKRTRAQGLKHLGELVASYQELRDHEGENRCKTRTAATVAAMITTVRRCSCIPYFDDEVLTDLSKDEVDSGHLSLHDRDVVVEKVAKRLGELAGEQDA
jgi:hypothetical protein